MSFTGASSSSASSSSSNVRPKILRSGSASSGGVKNKSAAAFQVTAEQILRESHEQFGDRPALSSLSASHILVDAEEVDDYRLKKRKEFEDIVRRSRFSIGTWIKYGKWEAAQQQFERARSVYERALQVDYKNPGTWSAYIDMEMKNQFIAHARNVLERVVTLLPRIDSFWYRYVHMEEVLGNSEAVRSIFERWMKMWPDERAWFAYIKFEIRHQQYDYARSLYGRLTLAHSDLSSYLKWAKFEAKFGTIQSQRAVFERALVELPSEEIDVDFLVHYAKFESNKGELTRSRMIYQFALDHCSRTQVDALFSQYANFEKQFGGQQQLEDVIDRKRRLKYEDEIEGNPFNYDVWFDYIRLEEQRVKAQMAIQKRSKRHGHDSELDESIHSAVREVYERAIGNVPPLMEKKYWKRYIYLWIEYALYEELIAENVIRASAIYHKAIFELIPHRSFTFSKLWILYAHFLIRSNATLNLNSQQPSQAASPSASSSPASPMSGLSAARLVLGQSLGLCPTAKIFRAYIDLELSLGEVSRVRKLYEQWLSWQPFSSDAWIAYAQLEAKLGELSRATSVFELAIGQPVLDEPEKVWKTFIELESEQRHWTAVRALFRRLLARSQHVKVWIAFAKFEVSTQNIVAARGVFEEADAHLKDEVRQQRMKEERLLLLQAWSEFETLFGDANSLQLVTQKLPTTVRRRRSNISSNGVSSSNGLESGEEYVDYLFPDVSVDSASGGALKLIQKAKEWKARMEEQKKKRALAQTSAADPTPTPGSDSSALTHTNDAVNGDSSSTSMSVDNSIEIGNAGEQESQSKRRRM